MNGRLGWPAQLQLVRHGQSEGNLARDQAYAQGAHEVALDAVDAEIVLSEQGAVEAARLGGWLRRRPACERPELILASPYRRARQTARILAEHAAVADVAYDERLRDREQGVLEGLTWTGICQRYPDEAHRRLHLGKFWYRPPGGESWADVAGRVRAALLQLRCDALGARVLVVAHDVPILLVRYAVEGLTPEQALALSGRLANCSLTTYRCDGERLVLQAFNDVTPLLSPPPADSGSADKVVTAGVEASE